MTIRTLSLLSILCAAVGCGSQDETMAERGALAGDVTSCSRNQVVEPASCTTPPDVVCSRPIEECAAVGCRIDGNGTVLYPDRSWLGTMPGQTGTWSLSRLDGFDMVDLGGGTVLRVNDSGAALAGCY